MKRLIGVLLISAIPALSQAEIKNYQMTYKSWANHSNYPASRCFSPSFKADDFCGSGAQKIMENCSNANSSLVEYVKSRCAESSDKVPVSYEVNNGKVVGVSGYFGSFNVNYSRSQYLKDIEPLLPTYNSLTNIQIAAYRVGSPLENRIYMIEGELVTGKGFKLIEYVRNCSEALKHASSCTIAEYHVSY